jgi:predicted nucleic acid-binding protein
MPAKAFFDTNVLIYAIAEPTIAEPDARTPCAEKLLLGGGVISVQILNEFAAVARRKLGMPWPDVKEALQAIRVLCPAPVPLTLAVHDLALSIVDRYGYSIYDALVAAAALKARCTVLYSEDMQDELVVEGKLTIRNPFR